MSGWTFVSGGVFRLPCCMVGLSWTGPSRHIILAFSMGGPSRRNVLV